MITKLPNNPYNILKTFMRGLFLKINEIIDTVNGGAALPYLVYVATIQQSGTNHPVATIHENTLGFVPTMFRISGGNYTIAQGQGLQDNKTTMLVGGVNNSGLIRGSVQNIAVNGLKIFTSSYPAGIPTDDQMLGATLEIRVYP